jgi:hypothetical protein
LSLESLRRKIDIDAGKRRRSAFGSNSIRTAIERRRRASNLPIEFGGRQERRSFSPRGEHEAIADAMSSINFYDDHF